MVAFKRFEALKDVKCLRTFVHSAEMRSRILHDILPKMRYLRVLSLYGYSITELPDSIGQLIYLRYLDLSSTCIKKLPDSVCCLYNLQSMILLDCIYLNELPSRIEKLINLRYLIFSLHPGMREMEMPKHIGRLESLQQLTSFIVGQQSGLRIGELGKLSDICGTLLISKMENVTCAKDALDANIKDKEHIDELALNWSYGIANGVIQSGVIDHILNNLQPHPNLKRFKIINYPGLIFPDWLGGPSMSNLLCLELQDCRNCSSLPPLGLLPFLQHLSISGMDGIERVGSEFYGNASSSNPIKPSFRSLQTLRFEYMYEWGKWLCCGCRRGEFPRLQELYIRNCPELTGKLPRQLRCLKKLEIYKCPNLLVASLKAPAISELKMRNSGELWLKRPASGFTAFQTSVIQISDVSQWQQLPFGTHPKLTIRECDAVESLLENGILETNICDLKFSRCHFFESLRGSNLSSKLKSLKILECYKVEFLLPALFGCPHPFLQNLRIHGFDYHVSFSSSFSLSFSFSDFPNLTYLEIKHLAGLEKLSISSSEGNPGSLQCLRIGSCCDLEYVELPALDLASYEIRNCLGLKLLAHTGSSVHTLWLEDCPKLLFRSLPSNIRILRIERCNELTPEVDWGLQSMASLKDLLFDGGCEDVESFPKDCLLPSGLIDRGIVQFPKLKSLYSNGLQQLTSLSTLCIGRRPELKSLTEAGLQHLTSLKRLSIWSCPKLEYLTKERLPESLCYLCVKECPLLVERCEFDKGQEWCYIAHIPQIVIDGVPW